MDTVHAAREAVPILREKQLHPIDRICQAQQHIKGLSIILAYALEKNSEHEDGPTQRYFSDCLDAIYTLATEIDKSLDELCLAHDVKPKAPDAGRVGR